LAQQAAIEGWGTKDKTKSPGEKKIVLDDSPYPRFK
jgi:hypothetical protein